MRNSLTTCKRPRRTVPTMTITITNSKTWAGVLAIAVCCLASPISAAPSAATTDVAPVEVQPKADGQPATRTVKVRLVGHRSVTATQRNWDRYARETLGVVSDVYERHFGIRFEAADAVEWRATLEYADDPYALDTLDADIPLAGADLRLAFVDLPCNKRLAEARPFSNVAIISMNCVEHQGLYILQEQMVSHELAHMFGAFHPPDHVRSIMNGGKTDEFDDQTARVLRLMRDFDFAGGVAGLDAQTRAAWTAIYAEGHDKDEVNWVAAGLRNDAVQLLKQKAFAQALPLLKESVAIDPTLVEAHAELGHAYRFLGQPAAAVGAYRSALRLDPQHVHARSGLVDALTALGRHAEAQAELQTAAAAGTEDPILYYNRGLALLQQRELEEAEQAFRHTLRIKPDFVRAYVDLGAALGMKGEHAQAIETLRTGIAMDPQLADAHNNLGFAYMQIAEWDKAIAALNEALRLNPDDRNAKANLQRATAARARGIKVTTGNDGP